MRKEYFRALLMFFPIIIVFLINYSLLHSGFYFTFWWIDTVIHFFGGVAIALAYSFILVYFQENNLLKLSKIFRVGFVVALVALTAVVWESYEFLLDYFLGGGWQGTLEDTMLDMIVGIFGGTLAAIVFESYS